MKNESTLLKNIEINTLLDFYGELLTSKQASIMQMHYNDDLSLAEIADIENISRQAVYDTIKRAEETLLGYENKLKFYSVYKKQTEVLKAYSNDTKTLGALSEMLSVWED